MFSIQRCETNIQLQEENEEVEVNIFSLMDCSSLHIVGIIVNIWQCCLLLLIQINNIINNKLPMSYYVNFKNIFSGFVVKAHFSVQAHTIKLEQASRITIIIIISVLNSAPNRRCLC